MTALADGRLGTGLRNTGSGSGSCVEEPVTDSALRPDHIPDAAQDTRAPVGPDHPIWAG